MEKRNCSINDNIKSEYPFIKGVNENAECTLCNVKFCIAHGGRSDDVSRVKRRKYKLGFPNKGSDNSISNYLSTKNISEMEKQLSLGAQESTFAYHNAVNDHNDKFTCTQTKFRAIIANVITLFATKQILQG
jgi:hypothetical protein